MEPLSVLVASLAGKLADKAFSEVSGELTGRIRRTIEGDPAKRSALQKCFAAGFEAALKEMRPPNRERLDRYAGLLEHWLQLPEAVEELAKLVDVGAMTDDPTRALDLARLNALFKQTYPVEANQEAYAGLNFPAALRAFVRAYGRSVEKQADKFPWLQMGLLKELVTRTDTRPRVSTLRGMYLDWLAQDCDLLPLSVYSAKEAAPGTPPKATLREVYVPLDVILPPSEEKGLTARLFGKGKYRAIPEELAEVAREQRVSALTALAKNPKTVLLGDPGSGKTTLTNHLALCLAMDELEPDADWLARLEGWTSGRLLPARVVLREFAAHAIPANAEQGNAGMLWQFLKEEAERHGYAEFFPALRAELIEKGGLLILDGLDEVPEADCRRKCTQDAITDFTRTAKKCRLVITCRTYAYPAARLEGFDAYPLLPFSREQIEQFIDRWYAAVRLKERFTEQEVSERAATLKSAVDPSRNAALGDLAMRPLLLTLMAMLHASEGKLPEDRADLYEKCVDLLLDYWQQRKVVKDEKGQLRIEGGLLDAVGIEKAALKRALYRIAFDAHDRQGKGAQRGSRTADIQPADLEAVLKPALGSEEKFLKALGYIQDRAGLIYWRDPTYTFPHRSFQEYLAACHLGNLYNYLDQTRGLVMGDLEWWREVYLLEVGRMRGNLGTAITLADRLCPAEFKARPKPAPIEWQTAILAGQALVELHLTAQIAEKRQQGEDVAPFQATLNRIIGWLVALTDTPVLTPRARAQAGLTLGALGDPRNLYELCPVPGGEFMLGEGKEAHPISLPEFWIAKYPVTCAQYRKFIEAEGYQKLDYWKTLAATEWLKQSEQTTPKLWDDPRWNQPTLPVVGVTWFEANAYCAWLTAEWQREGSLNPPLVVRLPTEAEWEKAASWDATKKLKRVYPWSNDFDPACANTGEGQDTVGNTTPVGIYPNGESPCYARDMAGNVWEWCNTVFQDYPYYLDAKHESADAQGFRVLRGGSWYHNQDYARGAARDGSGPDGWNYNIGFRVVVSSSLDF